MEQPKHYPRPEYDLCNAGHRLVEVYDHRSNAYLWDCPTCIARSEARYAKLDAEIERSFEEAVEQF